MTGGTNGTSTGVNDGLLNPPPQQQQQNQQQNQNQQQQVQQQQNQNQNQQQQPAQSRQAQTPLDLTTSMVGAMTASFALQNVLIGLPEFDGRNMPLKDFIQDVRNGLVYIVPDQIGRYTRAVLTKLRGPARDCTYGKNIQDIDDLVKTLKQRFAPGKDFAYYSNKIHQIYMRQNETIGDFYDHLNILLSGGQNALESELGTDGLNQRMEGTQLAALNIFIAKLPADIRLAVQTLKPPDLETAYKEAVRLESQRNAGQIPDFRYKYNPRYEKPEEINGAQGPRGPSGRYGPPPPSSPGRYYPNANVGMVKPSDDWLEEEYPPNSYSDYQYSDYPYPGHEYLDYESADVNMVRTDHYEAQDRPYYGPEPPRPHRYMPTRYDDRGDTSYRNAPRYNGPPRPYVDRGYYRPEPPNPGFRRPYEERYAAPPNNWTGEQPRPNNQRYEPGPRNFPPKDFSQNPRLFNHRTGGYEPTRQFNSNWRSSEGQNSENTECRFENTEERRTEPAMRPQGYLNSQPARPEMAASQAKDPTLATTTSTMPTPKVMHILQRPDGPLPLRPVKDLHITET